MTTTKGKLYTTSDIFREVIESLNGNKDALPEILDYVNITNDKYRDLHVKDINFNVYAITRFGCSEGIYTDLVIEGDIGSGKTERIFPCTLKTLEDSREAYMIMSQAGAEIAFKCLEWIQDHYDDLIRTGYQVLMDGKAYLTCPTLKRAKERLNIDRQYFTEIHSYKIISLETREIVYQTE